MASFQCINPNCRMHLYFYCPEKWSFLKRDNKEEIIKTVNTKLCSNPYYMRTAIVLPEI